MPDLVELIPGEKVGNAQYIGIGDVFIDYCCLIVVFQFPYQDQIPYIDKISDYIEPLTDLLHCCSITQIQSGLIA